MVTDSRTTGVFGLVAAIAGYLADLFDDVVAFDDFTEDGVLTGEPTGIRNGDEELAALVFGPEFAMASLPGS